MIVTPAFAQTAAPGATDFFGMLFPLLAIMVIFYFLLIRPQQRKMKDHQELVKNVRRGDTIVTSGGIVGKIAKVIDDKEVMVDLAEAVQVRLVKHAISEVRSKPEPAKAATTAKPSAK
ncbi:MAG: preprotein translocase subunit YajC [Pseudomonadota bacterium]|nr:preprotein translocase subunit YajC [Pseudomonadota bacterium]